MAPLPWLSIVVSVTQACEITLSPNEMQATAHAVAAFLDAPYDPLVAAAIVRNYLLDAPGVHVLLTGPTHAAYQEVAETVCAWINEFRGRLYKDDSATIRATECANLDVLVWGDLQTHLVTFRYHGTLKSFVWSFVSQRWLRFLRDQAARRRGGEGITSRSARMAQSAAGVVPHRRRDYVVSLEASDMAGNLAAPSLERSVEEWVERRETTHLLHDALAWLRGKHGSERPLQMIAARYYHELKFREVGDLFTLNENQAWHELKHYERELLSWFAAHGYEA